MRCLIMSEKHLEGLYSFVNVRHIDLGRDRKRGRDLSPPACVGVLGKKWVGWWVSGRWVGGSLGSLPLLKFFWPFFIFCYFSFAAYSFVPHV